MRRGPPGAGVGSIAECQTASIRRSFSRGSLLILREVRTCGCDGCVLVGCISLLWGARVIGEEFSGRAREGLWMR